MDYTETPAPPTTTTETPAPPPTPNESGYIWSHVTSARATDIHTVLVPMRPSEADAWRALYCAYCMEMDQRKRYRFRVDTFAFWLQEKAVILGGRALVDRGALQDAGGRS